MSDAPIDGVISVSFEHPMMQLAPVRTGSLLPIAYRLVTREEGNGNTVPILQGYYCWTEWTGSLAKSGGEWRDLATQDWLYADPKIPHSSLS